VFSVPTVFVVGAGAGADIDMPVGAALSVRIAEMLNFYYETGQLVSGDDLIMAALQRVARERKTNASAWVTAARSVATGIRYTRSIDSYINAHREDEKVKECAKLAIVRSILESEGKSAAFWNGNTNNWSRPDAIDASWLQILMYLLQDKIIKGVNFDKLFENFAIINFNYDRCIEKFLYHAIQQLYRLDGNDAAKAINSWNRIYHPYGSVGVLPWQDGNRKVGFGVADYGDIWGLSQEIFTYNEQINDADSLSEIRRAIINADRIIFLGFHFHQQNMDLLQTEKAGAWVNVYATAIGRAQPEVQIIEHQIATMLRPERPRDVAVLQMRCTDILHQYGTTLLR
jgi:hypothetical protein